MRVDIRPNTEGDNIEKRHPRLLRQELLRKRQCNRASDPGHAHDGHEACTDCGPDLMPGAGARDDGHRR